MSKNTMMTVTLVGLIGLSAAFVPWEKFRRPSTAEVKEQLRERFEQYAQLRLDDDWVALYEMVVPKNRERIDRNKFLQLYGHGMMKALEIELVDIGFTPQLGSGATKIRIKSQLQVDKLPPQQRASLRVDSPDDLVQTGESDIAWERYGGLWYFRLDQEILSGQSGGQPITPLGPAPKQGAAPGGAGPAGQVLLPHGALPGPAGNGCTGGTVRLPGLWSRRGQATGEPHHCAPESQLVPAPPEG